MDALRRAESSKDNSRKETAAAPAYAVDATDTEDRLQLEKVEQDAAVTDRPAVKLTECEIDVMLDRVSKEEQLAQGGTCTDDTSSKTRETELEPGPEPVLQLELEPEPVRHLELEPEPEPQREPAPEPQPQPEADPQPETVRHESDGRDTRRSPLPANAPARTGYRTIGWFLGGLLTVVTLVGGYYFFKVNQTNQHTLIDSSSNAPVPVYEGLRGEILKGNQETGDQAKALEPVSQVAPAHITRPTGPGPVSQVGTADVTTPTAPAADNTGTPIGTPPASTKANARDEGIKIHKRTRSSSIQPALQAAYDSYQLKDYAQADSLYQKVLKRYPNNRDALLGLAATAVLRGDYVAAQRNYERVLRSNPSDTHARLGLQSIQGSDDPLRQSSELKLLIDNYPTNAQLRFSLANQYAELRQWKEAQLAYFEALRLAPEQPDYAYNLAVSLDQMGLAKQALDYYLRAQALALDHPSVGDSQQLKTRIRQLRDSSGATP
jgi:tetratricopeptide (TPR) repeat protein